MRKRIRGAISSCAWPVYDPTSRLAPTRSALFPVAALLDRLDHALHGLLAGELLGLEEGQDRRHELRLASIRTIARSCQSRTLAISWRGVQDTPSAPCCEA